MKSLRSLNRNIIALGANSFFTDFSTEMILPLLPLFLDRFLHASKSEIGLIEGLAEFGVAILIAISGFYSDRLGKRKGLTVFGYALSNLLKPMAFFAQNTIMIATIRISDRLAKGIRVAPRDALISASTPKEISGFVFGFHKMMDGAGALMGSLFAFIMLWSLGEDEKTFRTIFALSLIPGLISMAILIYAVTDVPFEPAPLRSFTPSALPKSFYCVVIFQSLFSLIAMNYSMILLKAEENGFALMIIPLAYALYNLFQSFFAIPIGKLSDQYGKPALLSVIYIVFGLAIFAFSTGTVWGAWIGFAIYGFFAGGFNALAKAIISDTVSHRYKATAYGIYYTSIGIATLISLTAAGYIWDNYGSSLLFSLLSLFAIVLGIVMFFMREKFISHEEI